LDAEYDHHAARRSLLGRSDCADRRSGVFVLEAHEPRRGPVGLAIRCCVDDRTQAEYCSRHRSSFPWQPSQLVTPRRALIKVKGSSAMRRLWTSFLARTGFEPPFT